MNKIIQHLYTDWYKYVLEMLVLIIGIYGAFALDSWNQSRLERKDERAVLVWVKNDLQNTISELEFLNGIRNKVLSGTRGIIEMQGSMELIKDSIDGYLGLTLYRPTFNNKMGTVDLLFTSGKINVITNDTLKDLLIAWPGSIDDTIEEEAYAMKLFQEGYYPKMAEYLNIQDLMRFTSGPSFVGGLIQDEEIYPIKGFESDYEGLLSDREFINHLRMRASYMHICNGEVNELILQTKDIINLIDKELNK